SRLSGLPPARSAAREKATAPRLLATVARKAAPSADHRHPVAAECVAVVDAVVLVVAGLLVRPVQAATPQSTYATPDAAVTALVAALKTHNPTAIGAVL